MAAELELQERELRLPKHDQVLWAGILE
jgi:hypothetical protein